MASASIHGCQYSFSESGSFVKHAFRYRSGQALTPDMDANSIGGLSIYAWRKRRELSLMCFHKGAIIDRIERPIITSSGKRQRSFFDNRLGVFVQGNADRTNGGNDVATAGYTLYQTLPYVMRLQMDTFCSMIKCPSLQITAAVLS